MDTRLSTRCRPIVRRFPCTLVLALAAGCTSSEPPAPPLPSLTVETFFVGLDAMPDFFSSERFEKLGPELESTAVDVICLQGLWQAGDRQALKVALAATYPYSADLPTNESTPIDDPDPSYSPTIPCASAFERAELDKQLFTLASQCADGPGSDARVRSVNCVAFFCPLPDDADRGSCHQCLHAQWRSGATFREIRERCTSSLSPLAYGGEHGLLLLSRLPLQSASLHVLPSRWMRRAVVGASLDVPAGGGPLDVYCTSLGPSEEGGLSDDPYSLEEGGLPGDPCVHDPYPGETSPGTGWADEQKLQAERLVSHVQMQSAGRRAVVLGAFNAGPAHVKGSGDQVLAERGGDVFALLHGAFADGAAADYEPVCTLCPDNPFRGEEYWREIGASSSVAVPLLAGTWTNRIYLHGLDASSATASLRTHLADVVTVALDPVLLNPPEWPHAGSPPLGVNPLSAQYGFRSRIELAP